MSFVNDPQIWTLIGVFTAIMLGGMTLMTTLLGRSIDAKLDAIRVEMVVRFDAVNARFDATDAKIGHLDRDVSHLLRRAWGEPRAE